MAKKAKIGGPEKQYENIAFLSTYTPRKCGIATFTKDLTSMINKISNPIKSKIIAINDNGNKYDYSEEVILTLEDKNAQDYINAAEEINKDEKIKAVCVQHEFKIFGSDYGENLLFFLKTLKKPVITTFHTVCPAPSDQRKKIMQEIAQYSKYLVVMAEKAVEILKNDYGIDESKVVVILHGIHDIPYENNEIAKEKLGYKDKIILSSFGLLRPGRGRISSGKGCEYIIEALPEVVEQFPNVLYLIIGVTHPKTLKLEGETYRNFLKTKAKELGVENNIKFIDEYLELDELFQYLKASDIYLCPILNENQITSGTLIYAMSCGCAVISTPFLHAQEIITNDRGILLDEFRNSKVITEAIIKILSNPDLKSRLKKNSYNYTRKMTWENVAESYKNLFHEVINATHF